MYDYSSEIFILEGKIKELQEAIRRLNEVISAANKTETSMNKVKAYTETLFLAGQTIDRGKMEEMISLCETIIYDANNSISECNSKITNYTNTVREYRRLQEQAAASAGTSR